MNIAFVVAHSHSATNYSRRGGLATLEVFNFPNLLAATAGKRKQIAQFIGGNHVTVVYRGTTGCRKIGGPDWAGTNRVQATHLALKRRCTHFTEVINWRPGYVGDALNFGGSTGCCQSTFPNNSARAQIKRHQPTTRKTSIYARVVDIDWGIDSQSQRRKLAGILPALCTI